MMQRLKKACVALGAITVLALLAAVPTFASSHETDKHWVPNNEGNGGVNVRAKHYYWINGTATRIKTYGTVYFGAFDKDNGTDGPIGWLGKLTIEDGGHTATKIVQYPTSGSYSMGGWGSYHAVDVADYTSWYPQTDFHWHFRVVFVGEYAHDKNWLCTHN